MDLERGDKGINPGGIRQRKGCGERQFPSGRRNEVMRRGNWGMERLAACRPAEQASCQR